MLWFLKRGIRFGEICHSHPFKWDRAKGEPKLLQNHIRLFIWYLNMIITFSYYGFVLFRFFQTNLSPDASISQKVYLRFGLVYYLFPSIFQIFYILNKNRYSGFVHQYLVLGEIMESELVWFLALNLISSFLKSFLTSN